MTSRRQGGVPHASLFRSKPPADAQRGFRADALDLTSAAVHEEFDARDETRIIRGEKQRRLGDLFGLADPSDGDGRHNPQS
jgi:hypothetical protein